jgi:hypothetical protein
LLVLQRLIADIETVGISEHLESERQLHVLHITQEEFVQVATGVDGDTHLDLEFRPWLDDAGAGFKLHNCALRIILLVPSEMGWQVAKVAEDQTHLLMLALRVDVLLHTGIDSPEVHDCAVQANHWSLNLRVDLEILRFAIFDHDLKEFFNFLWGHRLHGYENTLPLIWFQIEAVSVKENQVPFFGTDWLIEDQGGSRGVLWISTISCGF